MMIQRLFSYKCDHIPLKCGLLKKGANDFVTWLKDFIAVIKLNSKVYFTVQKAVYDMCI